MQKIYASPSLVIVSILQAKLADAGIKTIIKNANPPAAGEIAPLLAWPELWLANEDQFAAANALVIAHTNQAEASAWVCPHCQQEVDGYLTLCWVCGESKPTE